jgi:SAM-dependent methyltransferase
MQPIPQLFDQTALSLHRTRASDDPSVMFLHDIAIAEVSERLKDVNRSFTDPVIIGWKANYWAQKLGISARCVPDGTVLDLPEAKADLVIHAMGLHWANDPVGQLIQMRRGLRPDGLMIASLFAGETLTELRDAFTHGESEVEGGISPRVAPMAEIRALGALLQRAGYGLPVADTLPVKTSYASPLHLMRELRAMGETNVIGERRKTILRQDTLAAVLNRYQNAYAVDGGRVAATFDLAFLTGWCPSETQQKPLRPGSGQVSLADALKPAKGGVDV